MALGSAGGRRGKKLAKLIEERGETATSDLDLGDQVSASVEREVARLSSIVVSNFRGFTDEHTFDISKQYILVYGPNGTGKSSLCEALEYALLGSISEADAKRIDLSTYIKNSMTKKGAKPSLRAKSSTGEEIDVSPNAKDYGFCFIEKNRIDGFARMAANTPQAQQQRLAALFGLDEFNGFVNEFNDKIDSYMDCEGKKSKELATRTTQIAAHDQTLTDLPGKEAAIAEKEKALIEKYSSAKTIDEVKDALSGRDGDLGLIRKNVDEIARLKTVKKVTDPGVEAASADAEKMFALLDEQKATKEFLAAYKDRLSLRDLYNAILANQERFENKCPSCESTIFERGILALPVDPYGNAKEKIKEFDDATKKEQRLVEIGEVLNATWEDVEKRVEKLRSVAETIAFREQSKIVELATKCAEAKETASKVTALELIRTYAAELSTLKKAIIDFNVSVDDTDKEIAKLEAGVKELNADRDEITTINASRKSLFDGANAAREAIDKFNAENAELIEQTKAEKIVVERNAAFRDAYGTLLAKLQRYNQDLPLSLAAALNGMTLKFYNSINKFDHPSDLLRNLTLPTAQGQKIEIEFEVGHKQDALHVLSEGHIRCLGLSILLSKIVHDDLPFLVFDDVVNAIDDEHRQGIIELLFEDDDIRNRQLIITTHGEEFVKRLENAVPSSAHKSSVARIDFTTPSEPKKLSVKLGEARHYLVKAEKELGESKVRDALADARRGLEGILNKLWKKLSNKSYVVQFQVAMRTPDGKPDLRSVADGMRKFLAKPELAQYKDFATALDEVLKEEKWKLLNKGTHEEDRDEEFDSVLAKALLADLCKMDDLIASKTAKAA